MLHGFIIFEFKLWPGAQFDRTALSNWVVEEGDVTEEDENDEDVDAL